MQDTDSDSDYTYMVETVGSMNTHNRQEKIFAAMKLQNEIVKFQLDSGSTVNILPEDIFKKVCQNSKATRPTNE